MNGLNDGYLSSEEKVITEQLEDLKSRVTLLHNDISCLKQCSLLSDLLQKMHELRLGLNQLEQDLLQTHLKCCISPNIKVPGEVLLALSKLSKKRHGVIMVLENEDNIDEHLQGGVMIDAALSAPIALKGQLYPNLGTFALLENLGDSTANGH